MKNKEVGLNEREQVFDYNRTATNLHNCEPFEQLNKKYILLQKEFADSFNELYENAISNVHRREYSKGGATIHRGFYSPSSLDLVTVGCNRGKLLKRTQKNNKYDYEYMFNINGDIICAKKYSDEFSGVLSVIEIELFVYEEDRVLSFVYEPLGDYNISFISECKYEHGKLKRYETAICNPQHGGKDCTEINVETFEYAMDLLESFCWYRYAPSIKLLTKNKFTFQRDEEGCLSTYTSEDLDISNRKIDADNCPNIYKVTAKRK